VVATLLIIGSLAAYFVMTSTLISGKTTQTIEVTSAERNVQTNTATSELSLTLTGPSADAIFYNGTVLTMEENQPVAQALAVREDKILAVGSSQQILALRTDKTKVIDLEGRTLLPGFVDAHTHIFNDAKMYLNMTLEEAQQLALENGITSVADMYVEPSFLDQMQTFAQQGKLHIRTSLYLVYDTNCGIIKSYLGDWYKQYHPTQELSEMLRIGGVKIFADGGSCGDPAVSFGSSKGDLWLTQTKMNQVVADAQAAGYQVVIHAIGDRAIEEAQNAIQYALAGKPNILRHRIEHNFYIRPDLLPRYGEIGIVTTIWGYVPACSIATGHFQWASGAALGLQEPTWIMPYRALLDANPGLHVAWHSDYPWWGYLNPLVNIYSMTTHNGINSQDGAICHPPNWLAVNTLSVREALPLMNIGAAYAIFRDEEVGSLKPGKFADLVILSGNPLTVDSNMIKDIHVLLTIVGGRMEYCASGNEAFCGKLSASSFASSGSGIEANPFDLTSIPYMTAILLPLSVDRGVELAQECDQETKG
jgi:predicted amidohydrolase YtcJ